jgi:phage recombination protein Bet
LILNKHEPGKRRMVTLVTIHGQRIIAQRCGTYRAASEPTDFVTDETLRSPTNPRGFLLARVYLWQQDHNGQWHPIVGEAYWDEFVPLVNLTEEDPESGVVRKTGEKHLDPVSPWARMPHLMLAKCATSQALRAGWPEQFGGLYLQEEFDRISLADAAASEIAAKEREQRRLRALAGNDAITVSWNDAWELENVPLLDFFRRARTWLGEESRGADEVRSWADRNREALRFFWAKAPADALELKRQIEQCTRASTSGSRRSNKAVRTRAPVRRGNQRGESVSEESTEQAVMPRAKRTPRANRLLARRSRREAKTEGLPI